MGLETIFICLFFLHLSKHIENTLLNFLPRFIKLELTYSTVEVESVQQHELTYLYWEVNTLVGLGLVNIPHLI